jgi:hypothetical protein
MEADPTFARLMEQHQTLLRQFVATELDLGITFCERALTALRRDGKTTSPESAYTRNADNANKAYHSAIWGIKRSELNLENDSDIALRMDKLTTLLAELK